MYCPKCGSELSDGSKFCGKCGEKIILNTNPVSHNKRRKPWKALFIIVPVVILLVVIFIKRMDSSSSLLEDSYVSLNNGSYNLVSDCDEENPILISAFQSYPEMTGKKNWLFTSSDDRKYLYFFSDINSETRSGTLCRIETDKLSKDSSENIKNKEVIASDVVIDSYQCTEDNTVFYQTTDDTLYYYDNNRTTMVASQVSTYNTDYTGYIIYYVQNYRYDVEQDITYSLYVTELKDLQNPVLLSSDMPSYSSGYVYYGDQFFLYPEYYTSGSISLFRYNFTGEIEKIADNIAEYNIIFSDDKIYFLTYNGKVYNLYQKNILEHDPLYQPLEYLDEEMVPLYNLCSYSYMDKQLSILDEDVLNVTFYSGQSDSFTGAFRYYTLEQAVELNMIDTSTAEELYDGLKSDDSYAYHLLLTATDTVYSLPENMKTTLENVKEGVSACIYFEESDVFIFPGKSRNLYRASFENGTVGEFSLISDHVMGWKQMSDTIYYMKWKDNADDLNIADLYSLKMGTATLLAEDIMYDSIYFYDDGTISAYTKYTADLGYELSVFSPEGEKTILGDCVTSYVRRQNSDFLYLSGDKLYLYDGKEKVLLETGTNYFWYFDPMEYSSYLPGYDYDYNMWN